MRVQVGGHTVEITTAGEPAKTEDQAAAEFDQAKPEGTPGDNPHLPPDYVAEMKAIHQLNFPPPRAG